MIDLDKNFLSLEIQDSSAIPNSTDDGLIIEQPKNSFESVFQSQIKTEMLAKNGKELPLSVPEKIKDHHRNLLGGATLLLGGEEPSQESILKYAEAQDIDPEIIALLMSDSDSAALPKKAVDQIIERTVPPDTLAIMNLGRKAVHTNGMTDKEFSQDLSLQDKPALGLSLTNVQKTQDTSSQDKPVLGLSLTNIQKTQDNSSISEKSIGQGQVIGRMKNMASGLSVLKLDAINLGNDIDDILEIKDLRPQHPQQNGLAAASRQDSFMNMSQTHFQAMRTDIASNFSASTSLNIEDVSNLRRQEQYLEVSRRLTQAIGERLTAQINKGAWRVEMDLHPKSLGRIEIQLEMRNGELEAYFTSSQNITRDLLQENFTRLKDILAEHGIDSAYIGLGTGEGNNFDGNPTGSESNSKAEEDVSDEQIQIIDTSPDIGGEGLDIKV
jgi:flagellar hook-length control protein FliK